MSRHPVSSQPPSRLLPSTLASRLVLLGLVAGSAALLPLPGLHGLAQAATSLSDPQARGYDIPAGPLGRALAEFATQSGLLLAFDQRLTSAHAVAPLRGSYTVRGGLQTLLANSGLEIVEHPDGSYALRRAEVPEQAVELRDITVIGTTATSAAGEVYSAPRSSVYISAEQLERYTPISVGDVLRGQPGVQVGDSRNGGALDVNIRGIQGQSRIAVTVDGAQQALDVYRGYAGTQQRSYVDPDLLSSVTINKGPSLAANAGGNAIGGSVEMRTLGVDDILMPGQSVGLRLTGNLWDNGVKPASRAKSLGPGDSLAAELHTGSGDLFSSEAQSGSLAFAWSGEHVDFVAGYAQRTQGNYFSGKHGRDRYRTFDKYGNEQSSVASVYMAGDEVLNSSSETESILLKTTLRLAEGHTLDFSYRNYDGRQGEIMPSDIFRFGTANVYQYPLGHMDMDTFTAGYAYKPSDTRLLDLKANLWMTDAKSSNLSGWIVPASQYFMSDRGWVRQDNRRIGGDLSNRAEFSSGIGEFALELGGSFQVEDLGPQSGVVISQYDLNANRTQRDAKRHEFSLSGKLEYQPIERLTVWAGARYNQYKTRDRNRRAYEVESYTKYRVINVSWPGGWGPMYWFPDEHGQFTDATDPRLNNGTVWKGYSFAMPFEEIGPDYQADVENGVWEGNMVTGYRFSDPVEDRGSAFAPSLGASYEFARDSFAYVSYTQGIRLPSLFETSLGTSSLMPSGSLKAERSSNWEAGVSTMQGDLLSAQDMLSAKLAYFNNDIKNYITRYEDPASWGWMSFSNADNFKVDGLEFQSQYDSGGFFADLSGTHYFQVRTCDATFAAHLRDSAHTYLKTENTPNCTSGSFMGSYANTQNPPEYAANLTVGGRFFNQALTLGGRMVYTSGPTETMKEAWQFNSTTPQVEYRSVKVFDAFLNYRLHQRATLNVALQNLTNRYYLDPLAQSFMPAPGRTLNVGFKLQL